MKKYIKVLMLFAISVLNAESLHEADVITLQKMMAAGDLTAEKLVQHHLDRITKLDPKLNAIITVNPAAIEQAKHLDKLRLIKKLKGPLHGIPVLLKDNIETSGPMATTAGALVLKDNITNRDAHLVSQLKEAGVIILGKTNLSEWANFRSERSSSGWSGIKGQTNNPYDLTRNPCGSSSGSAVAASAGLATLTMGTETNGSIVCPAGTNGVVGLKPSIGLVSRTGVIPLAHSQDTAGPITRSVSDAALMLTVIQGADELDKVTTNAKKYHQRDYTKSLKIDGLKGKRIGVLRSSAGFHNEVDLLLNQAIEDIKESDAFIIDDLEWQAPDGFWDASYDVLLYEFKHDLNRYLAQLPNDLSSLDLMKIIDFNQINKSVSMPWFGQDILEKSQAKKGFDDATYLNALNMIQKATRTKGIDELMAKHKLDAIIAPTGGPAWTTDLVNGDHFIGSSSSLAAISGYPNITVPMGYIHGLPVGLSIFSGAFQEPVVIEIAYAYEQKTKHRKMPFK